MRFTNIRNCSLLILVMLLFVGCSYGTLAKTNMEHTLQPSSKDLSDIVSGKPALDFSEESNSFLAETVQLYPAAGENKLYGYINSDGDWAIEPQFEMGKDFNGSYAPASVVYCGRTFFTIIDCNGELLFNEKDLYRENISVNQVLNEHFFVAKDISTTGIGIIDYNLNWVLPPNCDYKEIILSPEDNTFIVSKFKNRIWQYAKIDFNGNIVIDYKYSYMEPQINGMTLVGKYFGSEKYFYLDENYNIVIDTKFDKAFSFNQEITAACKNGIWGLLSKDGVWTPYPDIAKMAVLENDNNYICAAIQSEIPNPNGDIEWGILDCNGNWVIKPQYISKFGFSDNNMLAEVISYEDQNVKHGIINQRGEYIFEKTSYPISKLYESGVFSMVVKNENGNPDRFLYVNEKGETIYDVNYELMMYS